MYRLAKAHFEKTTVTAQSISIPSLLFMASSAFAISYITCRKPGVSNVQPKILA